MADRIVYRELSSLTHDLGFSARALYALSNRISRHYKKIGIPKENGELRTLHVPDDFLKAVQSRIASVLLAQEPISPYAMAYRFRGSTAKNAAPHVGAKELLKLDIRQFFDHITYYQVKTMAFPEETYGEDLRILLTMLCVYHESLPQGAPTSPAISNIIMRDFDNAVGAWCAEHKVHYTRYCDDMTFSGDKIPIELKSFVRSELRRLGFFLNEKKTVLVRQGQQMNVTGIVVNEKLSVSARYKSELRQEVFYCRKFGVASHLKHMESSEAEEDYLRRLLGRVNYVLSIEKANEEMKGYAAWLKQQLKAITE